MTDKYELSTNSVNNQIFNASNDIYSTGRISDDYLLPIIESYIRYYATGEGHTAKAKRNDLQHFIDFLSKGGLTPDKILVLDWTMQKTKDFIENRMKLGESPSTVSRRLATLKHLGRTLSERVQGFINPAREVKAPIFQVSKPQGLSEEEIEFVKVEVKKLLTKSDYNFQNFRNAIIMEFLLSTGLRADEIRILVRSQFSEDLNWVYHVKTKGKRFRDVYVPETLRPWLASYLERAKQEIILKFPLAAKNSKKDWDFYPFLISCHRASIGNINSFSLSPKTLWTIISNFGKTVKINNSGKMSHLHPHKLRHTFAHGLLNVTNDVRLVAQALGHSDVRTTMRYTERTQAELAAAIEKKDRLY